MYRTHSTIFTFFLASGLKAEAEVIQIFSVSFEKCCFLLILNNLIVLFVFLTIRLTRLELVTPSPTEIYGQKRQVVLLDLVICSEITTNSMVNVENVHSITKFIKKTQLKYVLSIFLILGFYGLNVSSKKRSTAKLCYSLMQYTLFCKNQ